MQGLGGTTKDANRVLEHTLFACESDVKRNCKPVNALNEEKASIYRCEEHTKIIINVACSGVGSIYEHGFGSVSSNNELALKYYQKLVKVDWIMLVQCLIVCNKSSNKRILNFSII